MINHIKRIINTAQTNKAFIQLIFYYALLGTLSLSTSLISGQVIEALTHQNSSIAISWLYIFILSASLFVISNLFINRYITRVNQKMHRDLKRITLDYVLNADFAERNEYDQGDLIGRFNVDVRSLVSATTLTSSLLKSIITLGVFSIGLAIIDLRIVAIFLAPLPLIAFIQYFASKASETLILPWKNAKGNTYSLFQDLLNNRLTIKAFQLFKLANDWIDTALNTSRKAAIKGIVSLYFIQIPTTFLSILPLVFIGGFGTYWVYLGDLQFGSLFAAISIAVLANEDFNNILNTLNNIPHMLASAKRVFPLWDLKAEQFKHETEGEDTKALFEFKDVSFTYPGSIEPTLSHLSFKILPHEKLGIMGESGSGKSSLLKLILGHYHVDSGVILFKGIPLQNWDKDVLRTHLASVTQNAYIFNDTIRENLKIIAPSAPDQKLLQLLHSLKLDDLSNQTPLLDIECGEHGNNLSGGQRQRLSVACAFLKSSKILLFDEATSALDAHSEAAIQSLLSTTDNQHTQILVTHRVHTLNHCDTILILDQGKIIEYGKRSDLLKSGTHYQHYLEGEHTHE